jgi:hypothetical protein
MNRPPIKVDGLTLIYMLPGSNPASGFSTKIKRRQWLRVARLQDVAGFDPYLFWP